MIFYRFLFSLSVGLLLAGCAPRPTKLEIYDVVINHVSIVDVGTGQVLPNRVVAISRGKIERWRWPTARATPPGST